MLINLGRFGYGYGPDRVGSGGLAPDRFGYGADRYNGYGSDRYGGGEDRFILSMGNMEYPNYHKAL